MKHPLPHCVYAWRPSDWALPASALALAGCHGSSAKTPKVEDALLVGSTMPPPPIAPKD